MTFTPPPELDSIDLMLKALPKDEREPSRAAIDNSSLPRLEGVVVMVLVEAIRSSHGNEAAERWCEENLPPVATNRDIWLAAERERSTDELLAQGFELQAETPRTAEMRLKRLAHLYKQINALTREAGDMERDLEGSQIDGIQSKIAAVKVQS